MTKAEPAWYLIARVGPNESSVRVEKVEQATAFAEIATCLGTLRYLISGNEITFRLEQLDLIRPTKEESLLDINDAPAAVYAKITRPMGRLQSVTFKIPVLTDKSERFIALKFKSPELDGVYIYLEFRNSPPPMAKLF